MPTAERYFAARRLAGYANERTTEALGPLLGYLRRLRTAPPPPAEPATETSLLLDRFAAYLASERGLAPTTVALNVRLARPFLQQRALEHGGRLDLEQLTAKALITYLTEDEAHRAALAAPGDLADLGPRGGRDPRHCWYWPGQTGAAGATELWHQRLVMSQTFTWAPARTSSCLGKGQETEDYPAHPGHRDGPALLARRAAAGCPSRPAAVHSPAAAPRFSRDCPGTGGSRQVHPPIAETDMPVPAGERRYRPITLRPFPRP